MQFIKPFLNKFQIFEFQMKVVRKKLGLAVKLYHFRSSSIKEICTYVKNCWEKSLENANMLIPAYKIKIYNTNDTTEIIKLSTLNYFNDNPFDENISQFLQKIYMKSKFRTLESTLTAIPVTVWRTSTVQLLMFQTYAIVQKTHLPKPMITPQMKKINL